MAAEMNDRDSDEEVLANLRQVARDLTKISLQCEVGARSVQNEVVLKQKEHPLIQLKRQREWLDQQQIDTEAELIARRLQQQDSLKSVKETTQTDLSNTMEQILKLQEKLVNTACTRSYKKLILERLITQNRTKRILFPESRTADAPKEEDVILVQWMNERIDELSREILKNHKALEEQQKELNELKLKNTDIKISNGELEKTLKSLEEDRDAEEASRGSQNTTKKRLKEKTAQAESMSLVVKIILQSLVVGSGIDWADNKELCDIMLYSGC